MQPVPAAVCTLSRLGCSTGNLSQPKSLFIRTLYGHAVILGGLLGRDEAVLEIVQDTRARSQPRIAIAAASARDNAHDIAGIELEAADPVEALPRAIESKDAQTMFSEPGLPPLRPQGGLSFVRAYTPVSRVSSARTR